MSGSARGAAARSREARLLGLVQHPEAYREVLIESGGEPIALSVWTAPTARAAAVFVPGTAVHPLFYEEFLDALCRQDVTVVAVHPQAHGKSPRVRRILRWSDLVANAVDASRWARRQFDLPVTLIGSSQGGLVALLAAARGAEVTGVIAHNAFDPSDPATMPVTRFLFDGSLAVPVVVLAASGDQLFPLSGIRRLSRRMVAPRVSLVVIEADCHLIFNEALSVSLPATTQAIRSLTAPAPTGT